MALNNNDDIDEKVKEPSTNILSSPLQKKNQKKKPNQNQNQIDYNKPWSNFDIDQIVSIDFGSFGFAAAFCAPGIPSHQRIVQNWSNQRAAAELNKNLAALLIDKTTKETIAIGYEAEEMYAKKQEKKEDHNYMYFEHFKPYLYSKEHIQKNVSVPAADGTSSLPLGELIIKSLQGVMKHSLIYINQFNKLAGINQIAENKIFWVLSVPAIWDEMSKELMKDCATKAGMIHFELGSEPIASTFHVLNSQGKDFKLKKHNKIMVLDCGGGTIDAACIEIMSNNYDLSELHHGDGILAGGLNVDTKFITLLNKLLPQDIIKPVKERQPAQWIRQRQEFVMAKFSVPLDLDNVWNVPFCFGINSILARKRKRQKKDPSYKKIKLAIEKHEVMDYGNNDDDDDDDDDNDNDGDDDNDDNDGKDNDNKDNNTGNNNKLVTGSFKLGRANLKINKTGWLWLHEEVLNKIVIFVRKLFQQSDVSSCNSIILVGGFANSKYLINRLYREFPTKTFLKPRQPHLAVVRGALYWICQRKKLLKTRAKYSYGIAVDRRWTSNDPFERQKNDINQGLIVENAFAQLIERNQQYEDGYQKSFEYYIPANADHLEIFLYASEDAFCRYIYNIDGKTFPTQDGKKVFLVKKFKLPLNKIYNTKQLFKLQLEYKQNGINLSFIDPNDDKRTIEVPIDITTVQPTTVPIDTVHQLT